MTDKPPPRPREKDLVMQVAQMRLLRRNSAERPLQPDSKVRQRIRGEVEQ